MDNVNLDPAPYFCTLSKTSPKIGKFRTDNACIAKTPCGLVPRPVCATAFQKWLVEQTFQLFEDAPDLASVSVVLRDLMLTENSLGEVSVKDAARLHRDLLHRAGFG